MSVMATIYSKEKQAANLSVTMLIERLQHLNPAHGVPGAN
jgi:hypothetical protein